MNRSCLNSSTVTNEFNALGLYAAMDAQRIERGLSWRQVAAKIWDQSSVLNERRGDHPISVSTLTGIAKRGDCTCQHALFILRWLGRSPESFLSVPPAGEGDTALPPARPDQRLRWNLPALAESLDTRRRERGLTWKQLAKELRCTEHQVTGIRTARFAIGMRLAMRLAMRIVQWLERPAADFIHAERW
jgi:transcriptional regulator with XRE-family HTH domain